MNSAYVTITVSTFNDLDCLPWGEHSVIPEELSRRLASDPEVVLWLAERGQIRTQVVLIDP